MCETLKPKRSGYSAKRRFRIVDLPAPEGPEITIGRCVERTAARSACEAGIVGAIVVVLRRVAEDWKKVLLGVRVIGRVRDRREGIRVASVVRDAVTFIPQDYFASVWGEGAQRRLIGGGASGQVSGVWRKGCLACLQCGVLTSRFGGPVAFLSYVRSKRRCGTSCEIVCSQELSS